VKDPDSYLFELIQGGPTPESLCQIMLRVGALDQAINFHENACGMKLLRKSDNPSYEYTIAMLDMPMGKETTVLELTYNYGVNKYNRGNEQQFAEFKDISAQFQNDDIGAQKYYVYQSWICHILCVGL
jgi:lactoylglutathione lyase